MTNNDRIILVTGATGQQGGAVTRHLLRDGWTVRALTRNVSKPAAQELAALGAEVVPGNLDDRDSLDHALAGVYGVFSVQNFFEAGPEGEVRQGKTVADASKAAGVQHLVFSSVGGAHRDTGIPHFDTKADVERYIQFLGVPFTIVQPVFFMDNFNIHLAPTPGEDGTLHVAVALPPERSLQTIAVDDIGALVGIVFADRETYLGKSIEIAGDDLTIPQVAAAMSRATGKTIRAVTLPIEVLRGFSEESAVMFEWFTEKGYEADIPALRAVYPNLTTFETWLGKNGWNPTREFRVPQYA